MHELPEKEFNNVKVRIDLHNPITMFCEVSRTVAYLVVLKINGERIPRLFLCEGRWMALTSRKVKIPSCRIIHVRVCIFA